MTKAPAAPAAQNYDWNAKFTCENFIWLVCCFKATVCSIGLATSWYHQVQQNLHQIKGQTMRIQMQHCERFNQTLDINRYINNYNK